MSAKSYYLYQKYIRNASGGTCPAYPMVYSYNANGTQEPVVKSNDDIGCGGSGATTPDYLKFTIVSDGELLITAPADYYYSLDDATTWERVASGASTALSLSVGDEVLVKANCSMNSGSFSGGTATFDLSGNIMSLVYGDDFEGQTSLPIAAFDRTFANSGVRDASGLLMPATTLNTYCYYRTFSSCSNLTTAPELPALTLATYCYEGMFNGCSSLTYIKCLATDISASSCTQNWVTNVANLGLFVKNPAMTNWERGPYGIPDNWQVMDA